jgi:hypothetical protein
LFHFNPSFGSSVAPGFELLNRSFQYQPFTAGNLDHNILWPSWNGLAKSGGNPVKKLQP